jgi:hypothetical protein
MWEEVYVGESGADDTADEDVIVVVEDTIESRQPIRVSSTG